MKRTFLLLSLLCLFAVTGSIRPTNAEQRAAKPAAAKAGSAEILRDEFGVPHIFASTLEDAAFAIGYAQAEDRLEELLKNYRKAEGTMSEAFGQEWFRHDYRQRIWQHATISRERYKDVSPKMRASIEAYQQGIKRFMADHPEQVPKWAPELHPAQIVALGRYIIWGWPEGEAGADLRRGGINPDPVAYRGSNQMLLAPSRTALKVPMAVIDPHLSWYGEFRFYEVRIYAGDYNVSGVSILGIPFPSLGHSRWASVAMTTGGPDTSDVYEEELNPANARQYKHEGQWREMKVRKDVIKVLDGGKLVEKPVEIEYTTHGPVVAHKDGKAYSMAIPYFNEIGLTDQIYQMYQSRNLTEMKRALSQHQLMSQNIMVGTTEGDIFYLRTGRVPVRPQGCDPSKPMTGGGACDWKGIHPMSDLVQITNPPQGYMQNNNCSPFAMMKDSPLRAEKYLPYIYNDGNNPGHQRAAMTLEELDAAKNVTPEQMINFAFSTQVYKAEDWQKRILAPCKTFAKAHGLNPEEILCASIWNWKRHSTPDSEGAMAFYAFKMGFENPEVRKAVEVPDTLTDKEVATALTNAAKWMWSEFRSYNVPYGRYFRVGRQGGKTYPVGGGIQRDTGMTTPRAINFSKAQDVKSNEMVGQGGQTSTQIVILTKTPQSFTVIPLGESDHKDSGHWDDQAEKLFSHGKAKSTYFLNKAELLKHVTAKKVLNRQAATARATR